MLRWIDKSKPRHVLQPFPIFMSFFMSLIWHGLWTGYVICFIGAAIADIIYKSLYNTKVVQGIVTTLPRPVYLVLWFPLHRFITSWITFPFHF